MDNFLCYQCLEKLLSAYETRKLCIESDAFLRKQMQSQCKDNEDTADDNLGSADDVKWDDVEGDIQSELSLLELDLGDDKVEFVDLHSDGTDKHQIDPGITTSCSSTNVNNRKCPNCGKSFQCEATLKKHIFTHNKVSNYCPLCMKDFSNTSNLKRHIATHSDQLKLNCDKCDNSFTETTALFEHLKIHRFDDAEKSDDFLLECDICKEKTASYASYNKHMKMKHNIEDKLKAFKCRICDLRFASKQGMYRHIDNIHENNRQNLRNRDKNFLCTECGKGFFTNFHLKTHSRSHNGEKPFKCNHENCDKSFSQSSGLKIHTFIHMNIRPFACKICHKKFTQYGHVREHLLTHTDDRPWRCTICNHSFRVKGNLKAHMLIHLGKKPHVCVHCGNRFNQSTHLRQHIMKKHKINPGETCDL